MPRAGRIRPAPAANSSPGRAGAAAAALAAAFALPTATGCRMNVFTPLCERCGYVTEGLPAAAACPECGLAGTAADRRPGSPWQQRPSVFSYFRTNWLALCRPGELFSTIAIGRGAWGLAALNLLIAGFLIVAPWSGVLDIDPARGRGRAGSEELLLTAAWAVPLHTLAGVGLLGALTAVEWAGLQALGRHRGWRITPAVAWQVCAHASVGWIVMGITAWVGLIVWLNVSYFGGATDLSRMRGLSVAVMWLVPGLGVLLGLLVFELLVFVGIRRCRFANRAPRSA